MPTDGDDVVVCSLVTRVSARQACVGEVVQRGVELAGVGRSVTDGLDGASDIEAVRPVGGVGVPTMERGDGQ